MHDYVNKFSKPEDCVIGGEFCSTSQVEPRSTNNIIKLKTSASCCIITETTHSSRLSKETQLKQSGFSPHCAKGDYIDGSEIHIKNANVAEDNVQTNPLSVAGHRVHVSKISSLHPFAIGFVSSKPWMSPTAKYSHDIKVNNTIKII